MKRSLPPPASRRSAARRAVTLIEALFFTVIASIVLWFVWHMVGQGTILGRRAVEEIALQQDIRNVVENMVRDVSAAYLIAEPHGETPLPAKKVVVYKYVELDASQRLKDNQADIQANGMPGSAYPFGPIQGETAHATLMMRVTYEYLEAEQQVVRKELPGRLLNVASADSPRIITEYRFEGLGTEGILPMAENVTQFEIVPGGYDSRAIDLRTGRGAVTDTSKIGARQLGPFAPADGPGPGPKQDRTVFVVLRIKTAFDKGPDMKKAQDSSMDMVTKIWSYPRLYEHIYAPFFSSMDHDLRY